MAERTTDPQRPSRATTRTEQAAFAGAWLVFGKLVSRVIDFTLLLVLARCLSPDDFGTVAKAMSLILVVEAVLEMPIGQALLRSASPTPALYDTAFTLSVVRGLGLALLLAAVAWPFAHAVHDVRVAPLVIALSLAPICRGALSPRIFDFARVMDFRREIAIEAAGKLAAALLSLAVLGATGSYWAIATATIAAPLVTNLLSYVVAPYRPRLGFSGWQHFSDLVGWNSLTQGISALNWQLDRLLIARYMPAAQVGQYSIASDLSGIPHQAVIAPASKSVMAALCQIPERQRLADAYRKSTEALFTTMAPIFVVMAVLANDIVFVALGPGWDLAPHVLAWFSIAAILTLPCTPLNALAVPLRHTRLVTYRTAIEFAVKMPATIGGILWFGVDGALGGRMLASITLLLVTVAMVRWLVGLPILSQLGALLRTSFALGAMALVVSSTRHAFGDAATTVTAAGAIVIAGLAGAIAYVAIVLAIWRLRGCPEGIERMGLDRLQRQFRLIGEPALADSGHPR